MNGYVLTVMGTVLISSILTMLAPNGKCSSLIKNMTKLVCLVVLIAPIPNLLGEKNLFDGIRGENTEQADVFLKDDSINVDEEFINYYCELRVRETQTALKKDILARFNVVADVILSWGFVDGTDVDGLKITKITVKIPQTVEEGIKKKMCTYLTDNYCSEVLIE